MQWTYMSSYWVCYSKWRW